jgi:hypothetical protein
MQWLLAGKTPQGQIMAKASLFTPANPRFAFDAKHGRQGGLLDELVTPPHAQIACRVANASPQALTDVLQVTSTEQVD